MVWIVEKYFDLLHIPYGAVAFAMPFAAFISSKDWKCGIFALAGALFIHYKRCYWIRYRVMLKGNDRSSFTISYFNMSLSDDRSFDFRLLSKYGVDLFSSFLANLREGNVEARMGHISHPHLAIHCVEPKAASLSILKKSYLMIELKRCPWKEPEKNQYNWSFRFVWLVCKTCRV